MITVHSTVAGLAYYNRDKFYRKLIEYQNLDESLIMISSHILSDIEKIVTDIVFLTDTKVTLNDPVEALEEKSYITEVIKKPNFIEGKILYDILKAEGEY